MFRDLCSRLCYFAGVDTVHGRQLTVIIAAVFLDMLAVSFFVPLLPFYWKQLGIRPELLGFVSSVYSLSQIASGVILGYVGDHVLGRKGVLLLSFAGSAFSYSLAAASYSQGAIWGVVASRVIVGLVKQTMTISKAAITSMTEEEERIGVLGHLRAVLTLAFMIGPTIGGLISKHFDKSAPAYIASAIFCCNFVMVLFMLPDDRSMPAVRKEIGDKSSEDTGGKGKDSGDDTKDGEGEVQNNTAKARGAWDGIVKIISHPGLGRITCIKVVNSVFVASLGALSTAYTAEKYNLEPVHLGYLSTSQSLVSLAVQGFAVAQVAKRLGEERALQLGIILALGLSLLEGITHNLYMYVALMPLRVISSNLITEMFEILFLELIPPSEGAAALGSLGLLKSIARVSGPLYGGFLVAWMKPTFGVNARPMVEGAHNIIILLALFACYPLRKIKPAAKAKTE